MFNFQYSMLNKIHLHFILIIEHCLLNIEHLFCCNKIDDSFIQPFFHDGRCSATPPSIPNQFPFVLQERHPLTI